MMDIITIVCLSWCMYWLFSITTGVQLAREHEIIRYLCNPYRKLLPKKSDLKLWNRGIFFKWFYVANMVMLYCFFSMLLPLEWIAVLLVSFSIFIFALRIGLIRSEAIWMHLKTAILYVLICSMLLLTVYIGGMHLLRLFLSPTAAQAGAMVLCILLVVVAGWPKSPEPKDYYAYQYADDIDGDFNYDASFSDIPEEKRYLAYNAWLLDCCTGKKLLNLPGKLVLVLDWIAVTATLLLIPITHAVSLPVYLLILMLIASFYNPLSRFILMLRRAYQFKHNEFLIPDVPELSASLSPQYWTNRCRKQREVIDCLRISVEHIPTNDWRTYQARRTGYVALDTMLYDFGQAGKQKGIALYWEHFGRRYQESPTVTAAMEQDYIELVIRTVQLGFAIIGTPSSRKANMEMAPELQLLFIEEKERYHILAIVFVPLKSASKDWSRLSAPLQELVQRFGGELQPLVRVNQEQCRFEVSLPYTP